MDWWVVHVRGKGVTGRGSAVRVTSGPSTHDSNRGRMSPSRTPVSLPLYVLISVDWDFGPKRGTEVCRGSYVIEWGSRHPSKSANGCQFTYPYESCPGSRWPVEGRPGWKERWSGTKEVLFPDIKVKIRGVILSGPWNRVPSVSFPKWLSYLLTKLTIDLHIMVYTVRVMILVRVVPFVNDSREKGFLCVKSSEIDGSR